MVLLPDAISLCTGYMRSKLNIPEDNIASLCLEYYTKYGTTLAGLVVSLHSTLFYYVATMPADWMDTLEHKFVTQEAQAHFQEQAFKLRLCTGQRLQHRL